MTSKYGWIDKLETPWSTFNMEFHIMTTRARDNNKVGDITRDNGPFVNPFDLPFVGVGKIGEEWDDQSGGRTPLNIQESIAGVSTGMAFAGRQTAMLYTSARNVALNILPLAVASNPQQNQTLEQKLQQQK